MKSQSPEADAQRAIAPAREPNPKQGQSGTRRESGGKLYAPDSPVDVPNRPAPQPPRVEDRARRHNEPSQDDRADSSWADNTRAAPGKKNARTSIF